MLTDFALVFVLSLCNGFFALSEMALVASRRSRLKQLAERSRRARVALGHAEAPERFLSTVQVGITLVMLLTGALAGDALGEKITEAIHGGRAAWLEPYAHALGYALGFVAISFIQIVFGELVPKRLALAAPETATLIVGVPMLVLGRLTAPFVWLLNTCSSLVLRLLRVDRRLRVPWRALRGRRPAGHLIHVRRIALEVLELVLALDRRLHRLRVLARWGARWRGRWRSLRHLDSKTGLPPMHGLRDRSSPSVNEVCVGSGPEVE